MNEENPVSGIIALLGGKENILSVTNCMTRLRTVVRSDSAVREKELKTLPDVLGLVHDRPQSYEIVVGPGKSSRYAAVCHEMGLPAAAGAAQADAAEDWKKNKAALKGSRKKNGARDFLKTFGDIFVPLIPGVITAGLCAGFASLIAQIVPGYQTNRFWSIVHTLLTIINTAFMTYITAWAGYRAAERFGATPILGGILGMITSLDGINTLSMAIGLYNEAFPLASVLRAGKGGVLAVIAGVWVLSKAEKHIRSHMPESMDIVFTPLLTVILCAVPYIFLMMPAFGYLSTGITWVISKICMSGSVIVRIAAGFISTAFFLPLVAAGMHHGLVALYTVQLQELGFVTLYPALAMAGAGQVGASIAIAIKARKAGNKKLCSVINGALPAGFLGVGEPLIYGVTLPLGKPFITAGIGAGFGGALAMAFSVASTTWGPSGLLGVFVMTAGPRGALSSILWYLAGLIVSYVMGFILTNAVIRESDVAPEEVPEPEAAVHAVREPDTEGKAKVRHGDPVCFGAPGSTAPRTLILRDPHGIHARPAGELARLAGSFSARVILETNGKSASASSIIELMSLGAGEGAAVTVRAEDGPDAAQALRAVAEFLIGQMGGEEA